MGIALHPGEIRTHPELGAGRKLGGVESGLRELLGKDMTVEGGRAGRARWKEVLWGGHLAQTVSMRDSGQDGGVVAPTGMK